MYCSRKKQVFSCIMAGKLCLYELGLMQNNLMFVVMVSGMFGQ